MKTGLTYAAPAARQAEAPPQAATKGRGADSFAALLQFFSAAINTASSDHAGAAKAESAAFAGKQPQEKQHLKGFNESFLFYGKLFPEGMDEGEGAPKGENALLPGGADDPLVLLLLLLQVYGGAAASGDGGEQLPVELQVEEGISGVDPASLVQELEGLAPEEKGLLRLLLQSLLQSAVPAEAGGDEDSPPKVLPGNPGQEGPGRLAEKMLLLRDALLSLQEQEKEQHKGLKLVQDKGFAELPPPVSAVVSPSAGSRLDANAHDADPRPGEALRELLLSVADMLNQKGALRGQAVQEVASFLEQDKPLSELPAAVLDELREALAEKAVPAGEEEPRGKDFSALLSRVQKLLRSILSGQKGGEGQEHSRAEQAGQEPIPAGEGKPGGGLFSAATGRAAEAASGARGIVQDSVHLQPRQIVDQVVQQVTLLARPGEQEMRVRLQPESLGDVLIRIQRSKGILSAEIMTQHLAVKELLEGQMENLRQRFQEMNLNVEEFHVFVGDGRDENSAFQSDSRPGRGAPGERAGHRLTAGDENGGLWPLPEEGRTINYLV